MLLEWSSVVSDIQVSLKPPVYSHLRQVKTFLDWFRGTCNYFRYYKPDALWWNLNKLCCRNSRYLHPNILGVLCAGNSLLLPHRVSVISTPINPFFAHMVSDVCLRLIKISNFHVNIVCMLSCFTQERIVTEWYIFKPALPSAGHVLSSLRRCTDEACHHLAPDFLPSYEHRKSIQRPGHCIPLLFRKYDSLFEAG